jgi:uncharacterized protein
MADHFHYGRLMHKAMRGLMAEVLRRVSEEGLPGKHHFFITFATDHPGVDIPGHLSERYPEEMTIVLQDWFEDLAVLDDRFAVTLNFGDAPETLVVPFDAITTFVDPSVEFGLRFDAHEEPDSDEDEDEEFEEADEDEDRKPEQQGEVVQLDTFRKH